MEEYSLISPKKLIIFGASNSGKSTFTKFFVKIKAKMKKKIKGMNQKVQIMVILK